MKIEIATAPPPFPKTPYVATYVSVSTLVLVTKQGAPGAFSEGYMITTNSNYPEPFTYFTTQWATKGLKPFYGKITLTCP